MNSTNDEVPNFEAFPLPILNAPGSKYSPKDLVLKYLQPVFLS